MPKKEKKEADEKARRVDEQKRRAYREYQRDIQDAMNVKAERKKQERLDYIEEGRKVRQRIADDILKLETIKARKL